MRKKKENKIKFIIRNILKVSTACVLLTITNALTPIVFGTNDPLSVVNNLSNFIFGLIRAVGMIILGFGVVQVGMSLKSHDPSQRANRFSNSCRWNRNYICKRNIKYNNWWLENIKE